jgi:hypothetical protein
VAPAFTAMAVSIALTARPRGIDNRVSALAPRVTTHDLRRYSLSTHEP